MDNDKGPARANAYPRLRQQVLDLDRTRLGSGADARSGQVWGVMFEIGVAGSAATFVALADSTTSMYSSTGGGIIGAGFHESVAAANRQLLDVVEQHIDRIPFSDQTALPADGRWILRAFTDSGPRVVDVPEADLRPGHPLWDIYRAAHALITQLRRLDEARST